MAYLPVMACGEAAQTADREQDGERDAEDGDGRGRCAALVAALEAAENVDGENLRLEREVAGDENHCAELPDRAGERERDAGEDRRQDVRQDHAPKGGRA